MNINKLKGKRVYHGFSQEDLGIALNISKSSYSKRENGLVEFTLSELDILKVVLKLSDYDIIDIFFTPVVA